MLGTVHPPVLVIVALIGIRSHSAVAEKWLMVDELDPPAGQSPIKTAMIRLHSKMQMPSKPEAQGQFAGIHGVIA
jgi:hypothetical protein